MSTPTTHTKRRRVRNVAAAASLLMVSMLVISTSGAVFTGSTSNDGNQFTAATVSLTDNDGGSALFAVTNVVPRDTMTRCIEVTYGGSAVGADLVPVKIFSNNTYNKTPATFDTKLNLSVSIAAVGQTCATATPTWTSLSAPPTVAAFAAAHSSYSNGLATGWTPSATPQTRAFRVVMEFEPTSDDTFQGATLGTTTGLKFTWEVQSGPGSAK